MHMCVANTCMRVNKIVKNHTINIKFQYMYLESGEKKTHILEKNTKTFLLVIVKTNTVHISYHSFHIVCNF